MRLEFQEEAEGGVERERERKKGEGFTWLVLNVVLPHCLPFSS